MRLPVVGPSYNLDAISFDCQRTINLYLMVSETGTSKSRKGLRGTPGRKLFANLGGGPGRGSKVTGDERAFVVSGSGFYEIFEDGSHVLHGTLSTSVGLISMAENGSEICIADGTKGYLFDLATEALTEITDPQFPNGTRRVDYQDGYFMAAKPGTGQWYISAIVDGSSWAPLDFTSAEASPDNLVCVVSDRRQVYALGTATGEIFADTGNATFPFERIQGAIISTGLAAVFTAQIFDDTLVWLGKDEQGRGIVWKAVGYSGRKISTQAIEERIASVADYTDSYAWVYHQNGHVFYCLQVKGLDATLVYDGTIGEWHERSWFNKALNRAELHRGNSHIFFAQKNLITDRISGGVYELDPKTFTDDGDELHRERIVPHISNEGQLIKHIELILDMEQGVGTTSGAGQDPQVMLSWSDDGGHTWSAERTAPIGRKGQYKTRTRWTRLGTARNRVYKFRITDPVFVHINDAYLNPPHGAVG